MQYLLTALLVALPALNGVAAYDADQLPITESTVKHRVPVTLGVMSKCPDARVCESVFDDVIKTVGHGMIDIRFSFIGKYVVLLLNRRCMELTQAFED